MAPNPTTPASPQVIQVSTPLAALVLEVQVLAQKHTKLDIGAALLSFPVFVATYGVMTLNTDDKSALKSKSMPDAWVRAAAELPFASKRSLQRLQKDALRDGFVSIEAADRFCRLELAREKEVAERARAQAQSAKVVSPGVALLAERIDSVSMTATMGEALSRGRSHATSVAQAGLDIAGITVGTAVSVGKGIGAVAGALNAWRKP